MTLLYQSGNITSVLYNDGFYAWGDYWTTDVVNGPWQPIVNLDEIGSSGYISVMPLPYDVYIIYGTFRSIR